MAFPLAGSVRSSCKLRPPKLYWPRSIRLGQGTSSSPAPAGGRSSSPYPLTIGCPRRVSVRSPAPSSVMVAWYSPAAITYCAPVTGSTVVTSWLESSAMGPIVPAWRRRYAVAAPRTPELLDAGGAAWGAGGLQRLGEHTSELHS